METLNVIVTIFCGILLGIVFTSFALFIYYAIKALKK